MVCGVAKVEGKDVNPLAIYAKSKVFVASVVINSKIAILSDGSPLRALIDVHDMSKAIDSVH